MIRYVWAPSTGIKIVDGEYTAGGVMGAKPIKGTRFWNLDEGNGWLHMGVNDETPDVRSTVSYEDIETREPHEEPHGTCDWGYCDQEAAAWRWSAQHGWLPVCADHVDGRDAAQARIEALEAQVGAVRSDLVEAVARLPRCKCGALASHEAYDATSDAHMACSDCLSTFANGMDGDEAPVSLKYVPLLQRVLESLGASRTCP